MTAFNRRQTLLGGLSLGITIELVGGRAFAASQSIEANKRLVVIICRGGLDGLTVSPPIGDPNYVALRNKIAVPADGQNAALKLDDHFGLHPSLAATHALAMKGEARIAPAVATPDRERSHFEAQDVLESGAAVVYGTSSGWLNRALKAMGPAGAVQAISVGPTAPLILRGPVQAASWSPGGAAQTDHRLPGILQDLYKGDPLLGPALANGLATEALAKTAVASLAEGGTGDPPMNGAAAPARAGIPAARKLGSTLAAFMTQNEPKQVAAVSMDGFDTHSNQVAQLTIRLAYVDAFLDGLANGMGPAWKDTVVVVATEFGRTARVNGTAGTDHGTASTVLLLGGSLKKGGIVGDWPTLASNRLYENRDTAPTVDMRGLFKGVLLDHLGVERAKLDTAVFPSSAQVAPVTGIV